MMNKQHLLCLSLFGLLMSSPTSLQAMEYPPKSTSPTAMLAPLAVGFTLLGIGNASMKSLEGMLEDIKSGKLKHTDLEEDAWNVLKSTALAAGLAYLGASWSGDPDAGTYARQTVGTGAILGTVFLLLKHACKNETLRLREFVGGTALAGLFGSLLAKNNCAWRF